MYFASSAIMVLFIGTKSMGAAIPSIMWLMITYEVARRLSKALDNRKIPKTISNEIKNFTTFIPDSSVSNKNVTDISTEDQDQDT